MESDYLLENGQIVKWKTLKGEGWYFSDRKWELGYVSRKSSEDECDVHIAGGSRKGEYYVLLPAWITTRYCIRQYLRRIKK